MTLARPLLNCTLRRVCNAVGRAIGSTGHKQCTKKESLRPAELHRVCCPPQTSFQRETSLAVLSRYSGSTAGYTGGRNDAAPANATSCPALASVRANGTSGQNDPIAGGGANSARMLSFLLAAPASRMHPPTRYHPDNPAWSRSRTMGATRRTRSPRRRGRPCNPGCTNQLPAAGRSAGIGAPSSPHRRGLPARHCATGF